jgi:hypothetical protein
MDPIGAVMARPRFGTLTSDLHLMLPPFEAAKLDMT